MSSGSADATQRDIAPRILFLFYILHLFIYMGAHRFTCMYECMYVYILPMYTCGTQRKTCRNWFSPSTMQDPGFKPRALGSGASTKQPPLRAELSVSPRIQDSSRNGGHIGVVKLYSPDKILHPAGMIGDEAQDFSKTDQIDIVGSSFFKRL